MAAMRLSLRSCFVLLTLAALIIFGATRIPDPWAPVRHGYHLRAVPGWAMVVTDMESSGPCRVREGTVEPDAFGYLRFVGTRGHQVLAPGLVVPSDAKKNWQIDSDGDVVMSSAHGDVQLGKIVFAKSATATAVPEPIDDLHDIEWFNHDACRVEARPVVLRARLADRLNEFLNRS